MNRGEIANNLRQAAEILRQDGWCQGRTENEYGQRCALGAIFEVVPFSRVHPTRDTFRAFITLHYGMQSVTSWNDFYARDGEQVAQSMEKAAAWFEELVEI